MVSRSGVNMQLIKILITPDPEPLNGIRITIAIPLKATQMPTVFILPLKIYSSFI